MVGESETLGCVHGYERSVCGICVDGRDAHGWKQRAVDNERRLIVAMEAGHDLVEKLSSARERLAAVEKERDEAVTRRDAVLQEWSNIKALIDSLKVDEPSLRDLIEVCEQWAKEGKARYCSWCLNFTAVHNDELREHMLACDGHPMREIAKERDELRATVDRLAECRNATETFYRGRMTRSLLDESCATCNHQPFEVGPGCSCCHAPCIHDHNVTVAANAEARTVEAIAAWLDGQDPGTGWVDFSIMADRLRDCAWRKP